MMKKLGAPASLLALFMFFSTGCASPRQEVMVERPDATSEGATPVPGENVPDDGRVTPGARGSNASVHW